METYVKVTKNADGSYSVVPTERGKLVFEEMEQYEGVNSLEMNLRNLLHVWDQRISKSYLTQAVEELKSSKGVMTPKLNSLLAKVRKDA